MAKCDGLADRYLSKLIALLNVQSRREIDEAVNAIAEVWQAGKQIVVFGNGGSAITSLHFVTDWAKSISMSSGKPFLCRTLVDNMGLLTAYSNDVSYADVFREQLKVVLQPGDVALAISGSGNSENVIRGVEYANEIGAVTIGLCGYRGGKLKRICRHVVWADVDDMQLSEDLHAIFGHIVMQGLCGMI
ncbi:SIS domain-containing protein [Rhodoblastus sp.]|uniref:SIS domain-containing protein n=1 Tax=Rhodoblastus sp. TaxID=1962975 RepID=UPI0035B18B7B